MTGHARALTIALLLFPHIGTAQSRRIDWPAVAVTAHLDSAGALHIEERQTIRFTGDWNGAERSWFIRFGQTITLRRLARIDSASGAERELRANNGMNAVDDFTWSDDGSSLRWRARLPSDPPFFNTRRQYLIETVHRGVLIPQPDGNYLLDHNFAMVGRQDFLESYDLTLTLDAAWQTRPDFTGTWHVDSLRPGTGFVVTLPLRFIAAGRPSAVRHGASSTTRRTIAFALVAALLLVLLRLLRRERALGRFTPLVQVSAITREWLSEHVFSMLPEVAGAAWDDRTSAPEVAATLARLVHEGKLSSRVETKRIIVFEQQVLHLTIEVDRNDFREHERALVDALFEPRSKTTNTTAVRKRYESTGFDPASKIAAQLKKLVGATPGAAGGSKPAKRPTIVLLLLAAALIGVGVANDLTDAGFAGKAALVSGFAYLVSTLIAAVFQRQASELGPLFVGFVLPIGLAMTAFVAFFLLRPTLAVGPLTLSGVAVMLVAYFNSTCNVAASRESPARIAVRKRLAAARGFFRAQLQEKVPRLHDEWFPYLIAFGLGREADKWFRAFGGAAAAGGSALAMHNAGGADSLRGSSGGAWSGFGGGGGFSGGGSSASFAGAIGGMASSVSAPSSSGGGSSGGGGSSSGGGSSGGGGGGGW